MTAIASKRSLATSANILAPSIGDHELDGMFEVWSQLEAASVAAYRRWENAWEDGELEAAHDEVNAKAMAALDRLVAAPANAYGAIVKLAIAVDLLCGEQEGDCSTRLVRAALADLERETGRSAPDLPKF